MTGLMASSVRRRLTRTAVAAAIAGVAVMGTTVPANAEPGCEMFGWRHPLCAGGAWDDSPVADDGIPGDNAAEGGIPAPSMLPNTSGGMSVVGTPGTI